MFRTAPPLTRSLSLALPLRAAMKADRKRLKMEKAELVNQMQQLYATLESREEQLRDFIRNYEQHRKVTQTDTHVYTITHEMLRQWCEHVNE